MEWLILAALYAAVGIGVFVWYIRGNEMTNSDQKKRSTKILVLLPELCLFWPVALLFELKRRRAIGRVSDNHSD